MTQTNTLFAGLSAYLPTYCADAFRTAKVFGSLTLDMEHVGLGLTTEAGEFATVTKRVRVYGKPLDAHMVANAREELGDYVWYLALWLTLVGIELYGFELMEQGELDEVVGRMPSALSAGVLAMQGAASVALMASSGEIDATEVDGIKLGFAGFLIACQALAFDPVEVLKENIEKLRLRFPEKYSDEAAEARADKGGLDATVS